MDKKDGGTIDRMTNPNKLADALRKAFDLGQRYWMLADSESYSDNRKSADVLARFDTLTLEALAEHDAQPAPAPVQPPATGDVQSKLQSALLYLNRAIEIAECNDPTNADSAILARDEVTEAIASLRQPVPDAVSRLNELLAP